MDIPFTDCATGWNVVYGTMLRQWEEEQVTWVSFSSAELVTSGGVTGEEEMTKTDLQRSHFQLRLRRKLKGSQKS